MFPGKADDRARVFIPAPADDRPSWTKVSVIAAVGFLVGVAWPKVAGVRLGPSLPAEAASVAAASASATGVPPGGSAAGGATPATPAVPAAVNVPAPSAPAAAPAASVSVGRGVVFACRDSDGSNLKGPECGALPGLDAVVTPRLRKLAECPDAASASGKLHLVAHPDFARSAFSVDLGKGPNAAPSDALLACARAAVSGASVSSLPHEHPRYSVSYVVTFTPSASAAPAAPAAEPPPAAADDTKPSSSSDDGAEGGAAQIVWEVAIVRDAPKTGKVVARLQRGASVHLGASKEGWYPVKFGDGFASDGWLYRGAVGR